MSIGDVLMVLAALIIGWRLGEAETNVEALERDQKRLTSRIEDLEIKLSMKREGGR